MPRSLAYPLALAALLGAPATPAQTADLRACRQLADAAQRLACYDALPLPATPLAPAAAAPAAPPAAPRLPAPPAEPVAKFGQESVKAPASAPPELKQMDSRIRGAFKGWGPNSSIELDNGQVWRVVDGSNAYYDLQDPKVIVHRGLLGAYFLEIEGVSFQIKVKRVR